MENHAKNEIAQRVKAVILHKDVDKQEHRRNVLAEFLNHRGGKLITELPTSEYADVLEIIIPWEIEDRPKQMAEQMKQTGPVQTMMTEKLVEGRHGNLLISSRGEDGVYIAVHCTDRQPVYMRHNELRDLAKMINEIADFLDPASL